MIELKNVSYMYGKSPLMALDTIDTKIYPGMHLLLGENGAGKTTMLKVIAGLLIPETGECLIDGANVSLRDPATLSDVFYLGANTTMPLGNIKNLVKAHACFFTNFDKDKLTDYLDTFGIDSNTKFSSMSLGTLQKALLAYSMSLNTSTLLLDEPTNGLDIESKRKLEKLLIEHLTEERTVIVSTHNVADMYNLFDAVHVMQGSKLRLSASADDIAERLAFVSTYSEIPDALFSAWSGGSLHSILSPESAKRLMLHPGPVDYRLLYAAVHSPQCDKIKEILNDNIPFK